MSHWWCCCGGCPYGGPPDCKAPADGSVSWFTHTVEDDNTITRVNHSGKCYTVYIDSLSGDQDETGDGTEGNPWRNLNSVFNKNVVKAGTGDSLLSGVLTPGGSPDGWTTDRFVDRTITLGSIDYIVTANTTTTLTIADPPSDGSYSWTLQVFDDDCIYNICTHADPPDNCPKVKVLVKGTIDYAIKGAWTRDYHRNLIIEPWEISRIEITSSSWLRGVDACKSCVWKNTDVTVTVSGYGFDNCASSAFDSCTGTAIGYGFGRCASSAFDSCTGTGTSGGIFNSSNSTFATCIGTAAGGVASSGFLNCSNSTFDTCAGEGASSITSSLNTRGYGFRACDYSAFNSCTGIGTATAASTRISYGYAFTSCDYSTFDTCTGTGTSNGSGSAARYASGFHNNTYSVFTNCDGEGIIGGSSSSELYCACGFYDNSCSSFFNCTTSAPVAGNACTWTCDDLSTQLLRYEETIEGVLKLEPDHTILDIRETIEGVLTLEITHSIV